MTMTEPQPQPALLRRHTQRGVYDVATAKSVFDDCYIAHVSYVDDEGFPACMPMIALLEEDDEHGQGASVYLHGHPSSKLMELVRKASRDTEDAGDKTEPVKVCITATKIDGLVLSSAPNGHTFNYRAATVHGTCHPVVDKTVKRRVMHAVTNKIVANRWDEVNPVASLQVSLVYVVRVHVDRLSVKTRAGKPGIQPRDKAVDGPDATVPPWTGVIPVWEQLGEPITSGLTPEAPTPSANVETYIREHNARHEAHAKDVAS